MQVSCGEKLIVTIQDGGFPGPPKEKGLFVPARVPFGPQLSVSVKLTVPLWSVSASLNIRPPKAEEVVFVSVIGCVVGEEDTA